MTSVHNVLAINGSYRDDGITDQAVEAALAAAAEAGAEVEHVRLREFPIEFCLNCRACTQEPGDAPGKCVHDDRMHDLVQKIEKADAYVLAAPTNFGSATAIFKRFMERLTVYAYWPWGALGPVYRKAKGPQKKGSDAVVMRGTRFLRSISLQKSLTAEDGCSRDWGKTSRHGVYRHDLE